MGMASMARVINANYDALRRQRMLPAADGPFWGLGATSIEKTQEGKWDPSDIVAASAAIAHSGANRSS